MYGLWDLTSNSSFYMVADIHVSNYDLCETCGTGPATSVIFIISHLRLERLYKLKEVSGASVISLVYKCILINCNLSNLTSLVKGGCRWLWQYIRFVLLWTSTEVAAY